MKKRGNREFFIVVILVLLGAIFLSYLNDGITGYQIIGKGGKFTPSQTQLGGGIINPLSTDGLVFYIPMESGLDFNDVSGNGNNGNCGNMCPNEIQGIKPQSVGYNFNGIDDKISIPDSPSIDTITKDFTIAMWVNFDSSTNFPQSIITEKNRWNLGRGNYFPIEHYDFTLDFGDEIEFSIQGVNYKIELAGAWDFGNGPQASFYIDDGSEFIPWMFPGETKISTSGDFEVTLISVTDFPGYPQDSAQISIDGTSSGFSDSLVFTTSTSNGIVNLISGIDVTPYINEWIQLIATYNGNKMRLYIDGKLVDTIDQTGTFGLDNKPITIGGKDGFPDYYDGQLDEIAVWNRAFTTKEIEDLYGYQTKTPRPKKRQLPTANPCLNGILLEDGNCWDKELAEEFKNTIQATPYETLTTEEQALVNELN
jgi:hypothetical protein